MNANLEDPTKRQKPRVLILGIGNLLFRDEGFGVRVIEKLFDDYLFPDNVAIVEGGVLGIHLLGTLSRADHLIVVDAAELAVLARNAIDRARATRAALEASRGARSA